MTRDARAVLRSIYQQLGVGQRVLALLFGRDQNTVQKHLAGKVIPEGTQNWLTNIESITLQPGYAVIIIDMPVDVPTVEYRRTRAPSTKIGHLPEGREVA